MLYIFVFEADNNKDVGEAGYRQMFCETAVVCSLIRKKAIYWCSVAWNV